MTEQSVIDVLPQAPFPSGGRLTFDLGEDRFVELSIHKLVKNNVVGRRTLPVSIWSLVGPYGIGRTWTMAWLGRQARYEDMGRDERWEAALVPGLGSDGSARAVFESIFRSTEYLREQVEEEVDEEEDWRSAAGQGTAEEEYLKHAVRDRESWAVLSGTASRFPDLETAAGKPKWTQRETQLEFLTLWFEKLNDIGVNNLLIFIDEFELLATSLSKTKLVELSDGLRSFFDKIETRSENLPNIQLILSLTPEGAADVEADYGAEGVEGWVRPLQSRMNTPIAFEKVDDDEAIEIAKVGIQKSRVGEFDDPYYPYTEDAVKEAVEACEGMPRNLSDLLNRMHQIALDEDRINSEIAQEAINSLDFGQEEVIL